MRQLISELTKKSITPTTIHEDNQSAICLSKNPQFHGKSKHIAIKYHFVRDQVKKGTIQVRYCRTEEMPADMMTKGLGSDRFAKLRKMIGMKQFTPQCSSK